MGRKNEYPCQGGGFYDIMKPTYNFTPNGATMAVIILASLKLWSIELDFIYYNLKNWFGILLFFAMMWATPFALWWFVGKCVYCGLRLFKMDKNL